MGVKHYSQKAVQKRKNKMINIKKFLDFINSKFNSEIIYYDEFKPDLIFIEIDCLKGISNKKLSIEISADFIKLSAISKEPTLDFSLHDYAFENQAEAELMLSEVQKTGDYIYPN